MRSARQTRAATQLAEKGRWCESKATHSTLFTLLCSLEYHQKLIVNCSATPTTCHLHLVDVNRWHHGIYECVATNSIGTIGRFYELDVQCKSSVRREALERRSVPPEVHSPRDEVHHAVGEAMVIECLIDANPTPDIRWLHRYPTDVKQEIDLSRQFSQETFEHASDERVWYIKHEQLNATRWKSSLFIQVGRRSSPLGHFPQRDRFVQRVPRRLMNSVFLCRAINRHGESEQPVHLIENHHYLKKYRHSTAPDLPTTASATGSRRIVSALDRCSSLLSAVDLLAELPDEFVNRSSRCTSSLFIFALLYILRLFLHRHRHPGHGINDQLSSLLPSASGCPSSSAYHFIYSELIESELCNELVSVDMRAFGFS